MPNTSTMNTSNTAITDQSTTHFADCLLSACKQRGAPVCVGLDPVHEKLPIAIRPGIEQGPATALDAIYEFSATVLDAVADHVPVVKFQSACFERYRADGVDALYTLIDEAHRLGLIVILDAKRGDIGISAEHYAAAVFKPWINKDDLPLEPQFDSLTTDDLLACSSLPTNPDALTVNPYLGSDTVAPFASDTAQGIFALIRTSNPGSDAIQAAKLESGQTVAQHLAILLDHEAQKSLGSSGYSNLGAVVGATKPDEIATLRKLMPNSIFLVPGYGAQGGTAEDVRACFNPDQQGALITASRSITYAFDPADTQWADAITKAAQQFNQEIRAILPT